MNRIEQEIINEEQRHGRGAVTIPPVNFGE